MKRVQATRLRAGFSRRAAETEKGRPLNELMVNNMTTGLDPLTLLSLWEQQQEQTQSTLRPGSPAILFYEKSSTQGRRQIDRKRDSEWSARPV